MINELSCRYDSRNSFYGKAQVETNRTSLGSKINLYSYGTLVASILEDFSDKTKKYCYNGHYSQTTTRHQKEFFKQNGLTDSEIKQLFKDGVLIKCQE